MQMLTRERLLLGAVARAHQQSSKREWRDTSKRTFFQSCIYRTDHDLKKNICSLASLHRMQMLTRERLLLGAVAPLGLFGRIKWWLFLCSNLEVTEMCSC